MEQFFKEHPYMVMVVITALFTVIAGLVGLVGKLVLRLLGKIDTNQTKMFESLDNLWKEFEHLRGEHDGRVASGISCK